MIIGLGGNLSGGKTLTAIKLSIDLAKDNDKKIISNIILDIPDIETIYSESEELIDFIIKNRRDQDSLFEFFGNSVLLLDEARAFYSARKSSSNLNEILTSFMMMIGKLDCDVIYTYQVLTSMIDRQLREITNMHLKTYRINEKGNLIIGKKRILKEKIYILAEIYEPKTSDEIVYTGKKFVYDPEPYFNMYNTREVVLVNREKYLSK